MSASAGDDFARLPRHSVARQETTAHRRLRRQRAAWRFAAQVAAAVSRLDGHHGSSATAALRRLAGTPELRVVGALAPAEVPFPSFARSKVAEQRRGGHTSRVGASGPQTAEATQTEWETCSAAVCAERTSLVDSATQHELGPTRAVAVQATPCASTKTATCEIAARSEDVVPHRLLGTWQDGFGTPHVISNRLVLGSTDPRGEVNALEITVDRRNHEASLITFCDGDDSVAGTLTRRGNRTCLVWRDGDILQRNL